MNANILILQHFWLVSHLPQSTCSIFLSCHYHWEFGGNTQLLYGAVHFLRSLSTWNSSLYPLKTLQINHGYRYSDSCGTLHKIHRTFFFSFGTNVRYLIYRQHIVWLVVSILSLELKGFILDKLGEHLVELSLSIDLLLDFIKRMATIHLFYTSRSEIR